MPAATQQNVNSIQRIICHLQQQKTSATSRAAKQLTYTADWTVCSNIIITLPNAPAFQL
jgi:hypothetical protein